MRHASASFADAIAASSSAAAYICICIVNRYIEHTDETLDC
ncbi:MAG: hypothetical protein PUP92_20590 [Rhizonema sp. PD38]|nr:hypothetical protein [Rhizonema sp. PD38]